MPWLEAAYQKAKENPDLLFYKLKSNSYKWSWAIIPLSVPFVWLLFPFSRRFQLYDHVVFVTYSLSFMTFLAAAGVAVVGDRAAARSRGLLVLRRRLSTCTAQLRGAYGLSRLGRTVAGRPCS